MAASPTVQDSLEIFLENMYEFFHIVHIDFHVCSVQVDTNGYSTN